MIVKTRFAPSPTGFLHIGGVRTALYNYIYAKQHSGQYYVRIEDTDKVRSTNEAIRAIIEGLDWLNINSDFPIVFQSKNIKRHVEVANILLENKKAYRCYLTIDEQNTLKEKSKEHAPVDTGALKRSIKYTRVKNTGRIPTKVKIFASAPHASFVHGNPNKKLRMSEPFNRTRPHFPPVKALTGWAKRHGMNPYMVANAIAQKGTPIVPFLKMGVRAVFTPKNFQIETIMDNIVGIIEKTYD